MLSRQHPTGDWLSHGGDYFDVRVITETWSKGWNVRCWLAPLQVTCEEIAAAGFWIERLVEPRPLPEAAAIDPRDACAASQPVSSPSGSAPGPDAHRHRRVAPPIETPMRQMRTLTPTAALQQR